MKALQYPGFRLQQVGDEKTRAALLAFDGHLKALYEFVNASISTDHGPGLLRQVAPIVIPEVGITPTTQSTFGKVGQLTRRGPDVFMKTGNEGVDTDWTQLPTGSSGVADPTATIGLAVQVGTATSYMRSDAAPPLSQAIIPTWSQAHTFQKQIAFQEMAAPATPAANEVYLYAKDKAGVSALYFKNDAGTETEVGAGGGGVPGIVSGSGAIDFVARWTPAGDTLGTGVLKDDGSQLRVLDSTLTYLTTLDLSLQSADSNLQIPDGAGLVWIDTTTSGIPGLGWDDPVLTFVPAASSGGGFRMWSGTGGATASFAMTHNASTGLVSAITTPASFSGASGWLFDKASGSAINPFFKVNGSFEAAQATVTSINGLTIVAGAGAVLNIAAGKTLTANASLTLAGFDGVTITFPTTSATMARTDAGQTFTGTQTVRAAATQDSIALAGRAGGSSSFVGTLTPTTLAANRTYTLPDATGTVALTGDLPVGANPTGTGVDLAGVNGSAATFMRSDGAPKINVGIAPTWTAVHTFSSQDVHNAGVDLGSSGALVAGSAVPIIVTTSIATITTPVQNFTVRNSNSQTGATRALFSVDRWDGAAYTPTFQIIGGAGSQRALRLYFDASNLATGVVSSNGSFTFTTTSATAATLSFTSNAVAFTSSSTTLNFTAATTSTITAATSLTLDTISLKMKDGMVISNVANTTGLKIGAAADLLGFYSVAPIARPTVAIAAAAFVANTSLIANDTATFDGYTIGQVVKALRNIGILT